MVEVERLRMELEVWMEELVCVRGEGEEMVKVKVWVEVEVEMCVCVEVENEMLRRRCEEVCVSEKSVRESLEECMCEFECLVSVMEVVKVDVM